MLCFATGNARKRVNVSMLMALFAMIMMGALLYSTMAKAEEDFLPPEKAFVMSAAMASPTELQVHFKIAPKYYMYRERFEFVLTPDADRVGLPIYPAGIVKYDPTFEKDLEVYHGQVTVRVPISAGATTPLKLAVTGQGCADAGLCYPPMTSSLDLTPVAQGYTVSGKGAMARVPGPAPQGQVQSARGMAKFTQGLAQFTQGQRASASGPVTSGSGQPTSTQGQALSSQAEALSGANNQNTRFGAALDLGDTGFAAFLAGASWPEIVVLCLVLGVLLSFTPCVLPMVPILLAIVAGHAGSAGLVPTAIPGTPGAAAALRKAKIRARWRGLSLAAAYVLGMSLVYTALGVAAGLIGASVSVWLQTPWVLTLFALVLAGLALAMFDVFTVQVPVAMQSALNRKLAKIPGGHYSGAFLMGMVSALIVGPCVAAPLAGVLLFISQTGDVVLGGSALFALAWGEGLLLLVVGATSGALLPKAGPWMDGIKRFFGILLLATAWWMVDSILPAWVAMLGWAFLALCSAVMLGAFHALSPSGNMARSVLKALGLVLALWAVLLLVGLAGGGRELLRPLAPYTSAAAMNYELSARNGSNTNMPRQNVTAASFTKVHSIAELDNLLANTNRPVMLDFYADWCVSCIEMEKFTFSDPAVARQMSQLLLVQADVTKNNDDDRALLKRFNLFGPPGIIFFDADGKQLKDARVIGFKDAGKFGAVLEGVLAGRVAIQ